ncbi:MAG TPA: hypothetical protein VF252_07285 [Gemmatimonadales bacterium]
MRWPILALVALIATLSSCQEKLTAPADCPALCPGGQPVVYDEVFTPIPGADSSFRGYVQPHQAAAVLVSNGLFGFEERTLIRFGRRQDSVSVRDTLRAYTIDSVAFNLTLSTRDTTLPGLQVLLYRIPAAIDSTVTFAGTAPAFAPESLIATIPVPDTLKRGPLRVVFQGADLSRVQIAPSDSGQLALGVRIASPAPTGVRLGALASGTPALFTTYVTADIPDTGTAKLRTLALGPAFNTWVSEAPVVDDSTLLAVGGAPSARSLLRFSLPARIRDSATIVRATLELTAVAPLTGLPTIPDTMAARALLADVGAKSPVNSTAGRVPVDTLGVGATTVRFEVVRLVELWLGNTTRPSALMLSMTPSLEAASFSRPGFYSSRAADPAVRPRLHISYLLSFPFETP